MRGASQLRTAEQFRGMLERKPFVPHRWLWNGHLQTIAGSRQRRRFSWGWPDAEEVSIDLDDGTRLKALWIQRGLASPTLVLLHGMSGSSRSTYMLGLSHKAHVRGWNSLLLDLYDRNPAHLPPRVFHAGSSQPVGEALEKWWREMKLARGFIVGVSMGGNLVLKLLGEMGTCPPDWLSGAAVISPLVDLSVSWQLMELPRNWLYQRYYVRRLKDLVLQGGDRLSTWVDLSRLSRVRTIREFDEVVTVPLAAFATVWDYYRDASSSCLLSMIDVPTLAIHSRDDPFLPPEPLLREPGSGLFVHLTERGGHVAFIEDRCLELDRSWAENRVLDFLDLTLR